MEKEFQAEIRMKMEVLKHFGKKIIIVKIWALTTLAMKTVTL